ncbi:hypothetical protein N431DRAFT_322981, partial [Stipitochalara longipes BDJ]
EDLTGGAHDILDHQDDVIHEIEAHSEGLQGNQILMYPVVEEDRDETTVPEPLPPNLDRHLLRDQTLVLHLVAVHVLPQGHALLLLAGDPEPPTDEEILIEVVEDGEEEGVQTVHHVEDHPLPPEVRARALEGHRNEELPRTLSAHLLHLGLDVLAAILVPYLGLLPDRLAGHLVEGSLAAEKGLARHLRLMLKTVSRICVPEVVNAGQHEATVEALPHQEDVVEVLLEALAVVEGTESVAGPFSVMNQQARGDETLLLPLHVMLKETGKLILEMKATGDPHGMKSEAENAWSSSPTRLVALSNQ